MDIKPATFKIKGWVNSQVSETAISPLGATQLDYRFARSNRASLSKYHQNSHILTILPDGFELRFDRDPNTGFYSCMFNTVLDRLQRATSAPVAIRNRAGEEVLS